MKVIFFYNNTYIFFSFYLVMVPISLSSRTTKGSNRLKKCLINSIVDDCHLSKDFP